MDTLWNAKRSHLSKSNLMLWFLLSVLIGIVAVIVIGLIGGGSPVDVAKPQKWGGTLFGGMLVFFYMLAVKDKKGFFLVLFILGLILGLTKTLMFTPSPIFRMTFGYTIPLMLPPLIILYLIWGLQGITDRSVVPISTVGLRAYAGLFVMAAISTLLHNRLYGSFDLFALLIGGLIFFYASNEIRGKRLRLVIIMLMVIAVTEAIFAIAQNLTGSTLGLEVFGARQYIKGYVGLLTLARVTGTFGHPSNLAEFFDLTLPLTVSMLFYPMKRSLKLLLLAGVAVGFMGLGMTYSRGGIGATVLFSGLVLLIHLCKRLGLARGIFTSVALGTIFTLMILIVPNPIQKGLFRTESETAYGRIPLMEVAFKMIRANPFFGVGLNNYVPEAVEYDFTPQQLTTAWDTAVHNGFLYIAGEIGIPGLVFFLALLVSVTFAVWPALRSPDPLIFSAGLGIVAGLGGYFVHWFTDLAGWTVAYVLWFVLGLAVALGRAAKDFEGVSEKPAPVK